ncbi:Gfo/Idh/MocA family protein [uncultured Pseudokineococcus sp.]|uniref:Gfo/Idh/MocA family protein n=1 Tax=uncultured Pseudokineococcus sp. TaxID=1642928 RepID=UPI002625C451|nr:Gfo/Idh/MocA family oxidoreductase [uncultured Pseudokineococcus sp.]
MSHRRPALAEGERLPVVSVGAGGMGRAWLAVLEASDEVDLVGVVDLDEAAARSAVTELGRPDLPVGADAVALARSTGALAVVDVTVPVAHHPVTTAALRAGLPVLGEKPVAATLPQALSLAAASEVTGELFMVSQSRRWNPQVDLLRRLTGQLGGVGALTTEFFRAPRFGGFREEMAHPLLVDMAIHAFDTARFVLGDEPVSAWCTTHSPPWSWYDGDASATAVFTTAAGARYTYTGSWCAPGDETSWNGAWRASGRLGTTRWDGDADPVVALGDEATAEQRAGVDAVLAEPRSPHDGIAGALSVFVRALRTGETPSGEVHENVMSLAMVDAAVESAGGGRVVEVDDLLERAREHAVGAEEDGAVREVLAGWPTVRAALSSAPLQGSGVRPARAGAA